MWGLPEQTVADALSDLQIAIDLQPEHISWYQLTIEAKTEFAKRTDPANGARDLRHGTGGAGIAD